MTVASFIAAQRADHRVPHAKCCRWLGVSQSWFYKWQDRQPTPRQQRRVELDAAVKASFDDSGRPLSYQQPSTVSGEAHIETFVADGSHALVHVPCLVIIGNCRASGHDANLCWVKGRLKIVQLIVQAHAQAQGTDRR